MKTEAEIRERLTSNAKEITLSKGEKCLVSPEDFDFLNQWKWVRHLTKGYVCRHAKTKMVGASMHRMVLGLKKGEGMTDHINGNKLDNRRENLRVVTMSESNHNRRSKSDGVYQRKKDQRWVVSLRINKQFQWLGSFATKEDAIAARIKALKEAGLVTPQTLGE